jgi:hypothetical protein
MLALDSPASPKLPDVYVGLIFCRPGRNLSLDAAQSWLGGKSNRGAWPFRRGDLAGRSLTANSAVVGQQYSHISSEEAVFLHYTLAKFASRNVLCSSASGVPLKAVSPVGEKDAVNLSPRKAG